MHSKDQGPEICITDDSSAERAALKKYARPNCYVYFITYNAGGHDCWKLSRAGADPGF